MFCLYLRWIVRAFKSRNKLETRVNNEIIRYMINIFNNVRIVIGKHILSGWIISHLESKCNTKDKKGKGWEGEDAEKMQRLVFWMWKSWLDVHVPYRKFLLCIKSEVSLLAVNYFNNCIISSNNKRSSLSNDLRRAMMEIIVGNTNLNDSFLLIKR